MAEYGLSTLPRTRLMEEDKKEGGVHLINSASVSFTFFEKGIYVHSCILQGLIIVQTVYIFRFFIHFVCILLLNVRICKTTKKAPAYSIKFFPSKS